MCSTKGGYDNKGRLVDCSNAVFILTSNVGVGAADFEIADPDELRGLAGSFMRREMVNRITAVIGFKPLGRQNLAKILDKILAEKMQVFEAERSLIVEVDQSARACLLQAGYSPDLGARPLERIVDEWVVQPLVDAWFANQLTTGRVRFSQTSSSRDALEEGASGVERGTGGVGSSLKVHRGAIEFVQI